MLFILNQIYLVYLKKKITIVLLREFHTRASQAAPFPSPHIKLPNTSLAFIDMISIKCFHFPFFFDDERGARDLPLVQEAPSERQFISVITQERFSRSVHVIHGHTTKRIHSDSWFRIVIHEPNICINIYLISITKILVGRIRKSSSVIR